MTSTTCRWSSTNLFTNIAFSTSPDTLTIQYLVYFLEVAPNVGGPRPCPGLLLPTPLRNNVWVRACIAAWCRHDFIVGVGVELDEYGCAATARSLSHLKDPQRCPLVAVGAEVALVQAEDAHSLMGPTTGSMTTPFGLWKAGIEDEWTTADRSRRPPSRVHASTTVHFTVSMPAGLHLDRGQITEGIMDWGWG